MRLKTLPWKLALHVLVILGGAFLIVRLTSGFQYGETLEQHWYQLITATGLISLAIVGFGLCWCLTLSYLAEGTRVSKSLRAFIYTWLGRYVPGTVPYHAARVLSANSVGTTKSVVVTSIAYETIFLLGSGALVGCVGVIVGLGIEASASIAYALAIPPLLALPVVLRPSVLVPIANRALRLVRREPIAADALLTTRASATVFLSYAMVHVLNAISFVLVLSAVAGDSAPNLALAVGVYSLAGIAGIAAIFVPSGIGVREAVIVALLGSVMGPEQALVAAGLSRALNLIADLVPLAILGSVDLYRCALRLSKRTLRSQTSPTASAETLNDGEMRFFR